MLYGNNCIIKKMNEYKKKNTKETNLLDIGNVEFIKSIIININNAESWI